MSTSPVRKRRRVDITAAKKTFAATAWNTPRHQLIKQLSINTARQTSMFSWSRDMDNIENIVRLINVLINVMNVAWLCIEWLNEYDDWKWIIVYYFCDTT